MPYINQDSRNAVDSHIDALIQAIRKHDTDAVEGVVNYSISRIVCDSIRPNSGWNYSFLNRAYGTFLSAGAEFLRRLVVPYEQKKSRAYDGGLDLPCYQEFTDGQSSPWIFNDNFNRNEILPCYDGVQTQFPIKDGYSYSLDGKRVQP